MKRLPSPYGRLLAPALAELAAYEPETARARVFLDANESPYAPSPAIRRKLAALARGLALNRYPDPSPENLKALALRHYGAPRAARVVLGNGSDELIGLLCAAFAGPGRPRLAVPVPTFSMFAHIGKSLGYEVTAVPLNERFGLARPAWEKAFRRGRVNLVFLASPNNPTGNAYDPAEISWILRRSGAIVVVDEAYGDYGGASLMRQAGRVPNLVVLKTLSKVGLAGLRFGMAFATEVVAAQLEKIRLPYNVSTFSQDAAALYFRAPAEARRRVRQVRALREALRRKMEGLGTLDVFPSDANFLLFRPRRGGAAALHAGLLRAGIRVRNLSRPGPLRDCLRVTIGTPAETRAFWAALRRRAR